MWYIFAKVYFLKYYVLAFYTLNFHMIMFTPAIFRFERAVAKHGHSTSYINYTS
jgi:hypothetical protein